MHRRCPISAATVRSDWPAVASERGKYPRDPGWLARRRSSAAMVRPTESVWPPRAAVASGRSENQRAVGQLGVSGGGGQHAAELRTVLDPHPHRGHLGGRRGRSAPGPVGRDPTRPDAVFGDGVIGYAARAGTREAMALPRALAVLGVARRDAVGGWAPPGPGMSPLQVAGRRGLRQTRGDNGCSLRRQQPAAGAILDGARTSVRRSRGRTVSRAPVIAGVDSAQCIEHAIRKEHTRWDADPDGSSPLRASPWRW